MNNDASIFKTMSPWVRHFLVHVVKRCAGILIKWIDDMQAACQDERLK